MAILAISGGEIFGYIVLALAIAVVVALAMNYRKVGPNQVLIVSGGARRTIRDADGTEREVGYTMRIGGGALVLPFLHTADVLSLEVYTVQVRADEALTKNGVPINAAGLAQVKVGSSEVEIRRAAEQFLGKGAAAVQEIAAQVLEGLLRAYLGAATVEEIYQNRDEFNARLGGASEEHFAKMGLRVVSFTLIDISDSQGYLEALGAPRLAEVKRDAEVAEAETDKDARIKTAEARKAGDVAKLAAETEVAAASRDFEVARAEFAAEINRKKAAADMAYELERQKRSQGLKAEEIQVRIVERQKLIELDDLEITRKEKELDATVRKTAEARSDQIRIDAEAQAYRAELEAKGRVAGERLAADAAADAIRVKGEAEAETMKMKADAFKDYNDAAIYQMVMDRLPELARAVSEPLAKLDKFVIIDTGGSDSDGVSKITGQVAKVLAQLPEVVEGVSGVDIRKLAKRLVNAGDGEASDEKKKGK